MIASSRIRLFVLSIVLVSIGAALGADPQQPADETSKFEVASIKENTSGDPRSMMQPLPSGRFSATNMPLRALIRFAYEIQDFQLEGGPAWLTSSRYDIAARADGDSTLARMRAMVRGLLADRFHLLAHRETRELPAYALLLARSDGRLGRQLRPSTSDCARDMEPLQVGGFPSADRRCGFIGPSPTSDFPAGRATMSLRGVSMDAFRRFLMPMVQRNVIDRTGLSGYFDGDFDPSTEFPPPPPPPGLPDPFDRQAFASIFTILPEQLGLKLESTKGPAPIVVIDRVERPTED